jgi:hypothetical protein
LADLKTIFSSETTWANELKLDKIEVKVRVLVQD